MPRGQADNTNPKPETARCKEKQTIQVNQILSGFLPQAITKQAEKEPSVSRDFKFSEKLQSRC